MLKTARLHFGRLTPRASAADACHHHGCSEGAQLCCPLGGPMLIEGTLAGEPTKRRVGYFPSPTAQAGWGAAGGMPCSPTFLSSALLLLGLCSVMWPHHWKHARAGSHRKGLPAVHVCSLPSWHRLQGQQARLALSPLQLSVRCCACAISGCHFVGVGYTSWQMHQQWRAS